MPLAVLEMCVQASSSLDTPPSGNRGNCGVFHEFREFREFRNYATDADTDTGTKAVITKCKNTVRLWWCQPRRWWFIKEQSHALEAEDKATDSKATTLSRGLVTCERYNLCDL